MAHVHAPVIRPNSEIAQRAREVHPAQFTSRLVVTTIAFFFTALGWVAGTVWFVVIFSALWTVNRLAWLGKCTQYGFVTGARYKIVPNQPK